VAKHMRVWLRMSYRCCGMEWDDEWPEAYRLDCPDCGVLVEAFNIVEVGPRNAAKTRAGAPPHTASRSSRSAPD
jgi:hypothetical protein